MKRFRIRFDARQINALASRFSDPMDDEMETEVAPRIKAAGRLSKKDLVRLCLWKTPRSRSRVARNSEEFVIAVTAAAFSARDERFRIEALTLLDGVGWPTASVILHFGHRDPYPVLDFRALWSLGIRKPPSEYDFAFWWAYTQACRALAQKNSCSMRVLDRALWQYSKERQRAGGS